MATECLPQLDFGFQSRTTVRFDGGSLTSDAGLLLLSDFDHRLRLTEDLAGAYDDRRRADRIEHSILALLRQRVYQIVAGYEDADDSDLLRADPVLQTVVGRRDPTVALGSRPTMSRIENRADCEDFDVHGITVRSAWSAHAPGVAAELDRRKVVA